MGRSGAVAAVEDGRARLQGINCRIGEAFSVTRGLAAEPDTEHRSQKQGDRPPRACRPPRHLQGRREQAERRALPAPQPCDRPTGARAASHVLVTAGVGAA